jgi:hypothetical protein
LDYDRKLRGYFYNQQHAEKPYELPGLWFSAEELNGLLICHQILQNISPGLLSQQITRLQQRINDLFKVQHQTPANISQKIKLLSIGRRLKDDAQFKKAATAMFNGKQINIHYNGRGENTLPKSGGDAGFSQPQPSEVGRLDSPLPPGEARPELCRRGLGEGIQKTQITTLSKIHKQTGPSHRNNSSITAITGISPPTVITAKNFAYLP